jgi:hypothetical protein
MHLNLLHKPGSELLNSNFNSRALAFVIILLAAGGFNAENLSSVCDIQELTEVKLTKSNANGNLDIRGALLLTSPTTTTHSTKSEVLEDIKWISGRMVLSEIDEVRD